MENAMAISAIAVSLLTGWGTYNFVKSSGKYTADQEVMIALAAGFLGGPIIAYLITK